MAHTNQQHRQFLNDRQADERMAEFGALTSGLVVGGHDLAAALRYPFFSDCLNTDNYSRGSWKRRFSVLTAYGWRYQCEPADVLFVKEGNSEREGEQILPLMRWLTSHGRRAGALCVPSIGRWRRFVASARNYIGERRNGVSQRSLLPVAETGSLVMEKLELSCEFQAWFKVQAIQTLSRYASALRTLGTPGLRPRVVVVNSEYHRTSRAVLSAARRLSLPTVLIQHGFLGQEWLHWPVVSEKVCLWGDVERDWYVSKGLPADRAEVTGSFRAFSVDSKYRLKVRRKYNIAPKERVVVFFAPNLGRTYHARASAFLNMAKTKLECAAKWFIRPHPSQSMEETMQEYRHFESISNLVPLRELFAAADLVLHDYSTMAFADFAGLETACLALDPPYPYYYQSLLGRQEVIHSVRHLCELILSLDPGYVLVSRSTPTMAAAGDDALERVGQAILEVISKYEDRHRDAVRGF